MKTILIVLASIVVVFVGVVIYIYIIIPDLKPITNIVAIYSPTLEETIYIKKKNWGITGDHQVIVISQSPEDEFEPNERLDYIYKGLSPLYYKFIDDTVEVYVSYASDVPPGMNTHITINQIVLDNPEMMRLTQNFNEKGLVEF